MLRQALIIALIVASLLLAALTLRHLGWWPGSGGAGQPPVAAPPAQPPAPPVVPADPLSPPAGTAQTPTPPLPPPVPPIPSVRILPPVEVGRPPPQPPQVQVVILNPADAPPSLPPGEGSPEAATSLTSLTSLNAVRALADLPPVSSEARWQTQCVAHAEYLVTTDTGSHSEDPHNPHYSAAGAACAHGHYYVTMRPAASAEQAMTYWRSGPFHLPQLLDPHLTRAALALAHDASGDLRTAVVLDVKRGRGGQGTYPVKYPAPGTTSPALPLAQHEYPDALPGCPGFAHPAGAPIALLLGYGATVQGVKLLLNGHPAETCLLTAETFQGATEGETRVGRSVLAAQGVAVAVPRRPLPAGAQVKVTFTTPGGPLSWSFQTSR